MKEIASRSIVAIVLAAGLTLGTGAAAQAVPKVPNPLGKWTPN